jgi:cystathionine beta-lyase family protein involved in aluminum resistance
LKKWTDFFEFDINLLKLAEEAEEKIKPYQGKIAEIVRYNQAKVLEAFRQERVTEDCFIDSSGYGYNDYGREKLESLLARIFEAEDSLARTHIVSGTHAISLALFGLLRPGDELLSITGTPYDTLSYIIKDPALKERDMGSFANWGISYRELTLKEIKSDPELLKKYLQRGKTKVVALQRSRGYSIDRPSLTLKELEELICLVKEINDRVIVFVDNCYGEFVETSEPTAVGADIIAGSLIKNPGGGLAPLGGYIAGKQALVEKIAARLTAPGLGKALGAMSGKRLLYQGLFLAPHIVGEALKVALFAAAFFSLLGYDVDPSYDEERGDIIQVIKLKDPELLKKFCAAIQQFSPVGAHFHPEAASMPGYKDKVIMAAGTFVHGASLELTADAPLRPPFAVFLQGGLTYEHALSAIIACAQALLSYIAERGRGER